MFTSTNKPQNSIFGTQPQTQTGNSIFGGNQQQPATNPFNQQQGTNMFNSQQPQTNPLFGNQPQQGTPFNANQTQNPTPGLFNQSQQQRGNIFGPQTTNQPQQGANIFGGQQQQGGNIFGGQQQQPQQQGGNIFGGQQQQPQQGGNVLGMQQQQVNLNQLFQAGMTGQTNTEQMKFQIGEFCRRVDIKNLDHIRIDEMNMYRDYRLADLPDEVKKTIMVVINNMRDLRTAIDAIKKENEELDKKAAEYCKNVQEKLIKYKECLIQNIQQSNLLEEVKQEVQLLDNQVNGFIIPLYNAYKNGKHQSFDSPDEFSSTIAKKVLQKMIELNNKVDEMIACQQNDQNSVSDEDTTALQVLQQLLNYYENVSAKVLEFGNRFKMIKRAQIDRHSRSNSCEEVLRRIQDKVNTKMQRDFKSYDLIKEIETILQKREKREQEMASLYKESMQKRGGSYYGNQPTYSWNKY